MNQNYQASLLNQSSKKFSQLLQAQIEIRDESIRRLKFIYIISLDSGFEDKVGIFLVLLIKFFHPTGKGIRGYHQVFSTLVVIVRQNLLIMETHHKIVQIVSYQLRVLFLTIRVFYQIDHLLKGLCLYAQLNCIDSLEFGFEGKTCGKGIRRAGVSHCSKILHLIVGWQRKVEAYSVILRNGFSEEYGNIGYRSRFLDIYVIDAVGALETSEQRLSRYEQSEGKGHLLFMIYNT